MAFVSLDNCLDNFFYHSYSWYRHCSSLERWRPCGPLSLSANDSPGHGELERLNIHRCKTLTDYFGDHVDSIWRRRTTAQQLVKRFKKLGLRRERIAAENLASVYSKLKVWKDAPDFSRLDSLLGETARLQREKAGDQHPVWAVMVETRALPQLCFVVENVATVLGVPIQIFHGPPAEKLLRESNIHELIEANKVHLTPLAVHTLTACDYNTLLLSRQFWELVRGRKKVLIFQTDSLLCPRSTYSLKDFIEFDLIGSRWDRARPIGIIADGGFGGLSLRDYEKTLVCLDRFPPHSWPGGEDGYYAFHFDLLGARIGRGNECSKFCIQTDLKYRSFGVHRPNDLRPADMRRLLAYCPEVEWIL
jgi:Protein of unknown function (DUF5672)